MSVDMTRCWYSKSFHLQTYLLLPLSFLFRLIVMLRRGCYKVGLLKSISFSVPVIVVGNISVGGTGKTPMVIWLANFLKAQGYKPGIVSRGMGGKRHAKPCVVTVNSTAQDVGDEALLLQRNTGCPVVVGVNRVAAVQQLLQQSQCDIVISDDGLQHYRLGRSLEIAMVDGIRQFGNQQLLPAGPLRETISRLKHCDFVVVKGGKDGEIYSMALTPSQLISLKNPQQTFALSNFPHKLIHAVAGIGHPDRFFQTLRAAGFNLIEHRFPDHYHYAAHEISFSDIYPVVMTEKDAVKCAAFADLNCWYLPVQATMSDNFAHDIMKKLSTFKGHDNETENDFNKRSCALPNA